MNQKRIYNKGVALRDCAKRDYEGVLALITEHNRLKYLIESAIRDVRMWGNRLASLKGQEGTRPYEVAEEKFAASKAAYEKLEHQGAHVEDKRLEVAGRLFAALHAIVKAGSFNWPCIEQSRQRKIKALGIKRYRLYGEMVVHRRAGKKLRKQAIEALELGDGTKAVQLMRRAQTDEKEAAEYAPILKTIDERVLELQSPPAIYVEALATWIPSLMPQEVAIMTRTEISPLIAEEVGTGA